MLAKCPLQVWLTVSAQLSLLLFLVSIARWSFPKTKNHLLVPPPFFFFFPYWIMILQKLFSIEKSSRVPFNIFKATYRKKLFLRYRQVWKETVKTVICLCIQHLMTKYCKHKIENDTTLFSRLMWEETQTAQIMRCCNSYKKCGSADEGPVMSRRVWASNGFISDPSEAAADRLFSWGTGCSCSNNGRGPHIQSLHGSTRREEGSPVLCLWARKL